MIKLALILGIIFIIIFGLLNLFLLIEITKLKVKIFNMKNKAEDVLDEFEIKLKTELETAHQKGIEFGKNLITYNETKK